MEASQLLNAPAPDTIEKAGLLQQLFEQQVVRTPQAVALRFGLGALTYEELDGAATHLAHMLVRQAPIQPYIGLSTTRGLESIIGILAILKAGKAYLPLDPTYPQERLQQYVTDSGLTHCVALDEDAPIFEALGLTVLHSGQPGEEQPGLLPTAEPTDTAYIIYTSGSTGQPKGVCVAHAGVVNLIEWQARNSVMTEGCSALLFSPLTFDASIQEIFFALSVGATLVLIENDLRLDPVRLLDFIDEQGINRLDLPFVTLQYLTEAAVTAQHFPACLREVLTGGEQLKITPQIEQFFQALPHCDFYNQYGPTETSITVTNLQLTGSPAQWPRLPTIGQAIDGVEILILDEQLRPVPAGQAGELCIGGDCVAQGYLHKPELTNTRFVTLQLPGQLPKRFYRSGDLARYRPDGNLDYLGRIDTQVKIRGNRIELGEIEVLLNHEPGIKQAVVVVQEDQTGQKTLAAFLVAAASPPSLLTLRESLAQKLPDYMLPAAFGWLDELPKTANGKVDRNALPAAALQRLETSDFAPAATDTEKLICSVWQHVLPYGPIGRNDNFFYLGGNSLVAVKMMGLLEKQTGKRLSLSSLFEAPTVAMLAQLLDNRHSSKPLKSLVPIQPLGNRPPLYIVHGMGLNILIFTNLAQHLHQDQPVYGLQAQGLDGISLPPDSIEQIAANYIAEIRQQNPDGPYALAGYSLGGIIVFEMARQLQALGKTVSSLLVLDGEASELTADQSRWQAWQLSWRIKLSKVKWVLGNVVNRPAETALYYKPLFTGLAHKALHRLGYRPAEPPAHSAQQPDNTQQVMDIYAHAGNTYRMRPLDVHMTVYKARQRIHAIYDTRNYGWQPFARRGLQVHEVGGDHETMLQPPYCQHLARLLQQDLDKALIRQPQAMQHEVGERILH